jgi:dATP pyrophosphohydrolase
MPEVVSDIVDVYVFRRLNARVQFLLLQRRADVALGQTWQSFHTHILSDETTLAAATRAVLELSGLRVSAVFSADYVNQFYDDTRDVLVLAPVIAVNVSPQAPVQLGGELRDCAWLDRDEATARLPFSGQRWAVRHIDEIMSIGDRESELYRLRMPAPRPAMQERRPITVEMGQDSEAREAAPLDAWAPDTQPPLPNTAELQTIKSFSVQATAGETTIPSPEEFEESGNMDEEPDAAGDRQPENRSYVPVTDE